VLADADADEDAVADGVLVVTEGLALLVERVVGVYVGVARPQISVGMGVVSSSVKHGGSDSNRHRRPLYCAVVVVVADEDVDSEDVEMGTRVSGLGVVVGPREVWV